VHRQKVPTYLSRDPSQSRNKMLWYASNGNSISPSLEQGAVQEKARQGRSSAREQRCVTATQAVSQEISDNAHERLDAKGHVSMRVIIICARHRIVDLAVLRPRRMRVVMRSRQPAEPHVAIQAIQIESRLQYQGVHAR